MAKIGIRGALAVISTFSISFAATVALNSPQRVEPKIVEESTIKPVIEQLEIEQLDDYLPEICYVVRGLNKNMLAVRNEPRHESTAIAGLLNGDRVILPSVYSENYYVLAVYYGRGDHTGEFNQVMGGWVNARYLETCP